MSVDDAGIGTYSISGNINFYDSFYKDIYFYPFDNDGLFNTLSLYKDYFYPNIPVGVINEAFKFKYRPDLTTNEITYDTSVVGTTVNITQNPSTTEIQLNHPTDSFNLITSLNIGSSINIKIEQFNFISNY
jgi:hypothetical protein